MRNAAEAGADRITLSVDSKAGVSRMWVTDNGPGLPLRVQDNLFRPFTGSGRHGGTGLGLTIARDLIRAHGGDLVLSQTGPLGTVFIMELVVSEAATLTQQDYARPLAELMPLPPTPPAPEPVPVAAAAPTPHPRRSPKPRRKKPAVADVPVPAAGELQAALPLAGASSAKVAARRTKPPERPAAPPAAPEPMPPLHPDLVDLPGAHRRVH
jgi:hypothetical protein